MAYRLRKLQRIQTSNSNHLDMSNCFKVSSRYRPDGFRDSTVLTSNYQFMVHKRYKNKLNIIISRIYIEIDETM